MELKEIIKFQPRKENPFPGLVIDADTWRDAHNYHQDQQRLHILTFHNTGIVGGLEVTDNNPPDLSVTINPGIGIDPAGNTVIVPQNQRYEIQTREAGTVHLVITFREVPAGPYQPPDGGQPTRLMDAYRIQELSKLPDEPCIEMARIDFDPSIKTITKPKTPSKPGKNEIDFRFRKGAGIGAIAAPTLAPTPAPAPEPVMPEKTSPPFIQPPIVTKETIVLGYTALGEGSKGLHLSGLRNLIRETNEHRDYEVEIEEIASLEKDLKRCKLLYITGNSAFDLSAEQQEALAGFLKSGGTIFGEGCSEAQGEAPSRGAKEFGLAFNQLASHLKCKLANVQRGHPLLLASHIFSGAPQGAEPGMLLEGNHMIYSGSDYGCAWQGGHQNQPLPREIIRSSMEMGGNIIAYAQTIHK
ncbi:MAG: DUF4159 domain-containing protein [Chloroflexota bacterium]|nr:DUF4159 domain-containing protein [Chloroflexota bacterium]